MIQSYFFDFIMINNNVCNNCGSSSFVSDRSLGGRMVCFKCGSSSFRKKSFSLINKNLFYLFIGIIVLFIIII